MSGSILTGPVPSFSKTIRGYRAVNIRVGDSLESIAQRELGDASQWYDLVELNNLSWPWITDDPTKAVRGSILLSMRDSILVPSTAPAPTGVTDSPDIFGTDCLLINGQLAVNSRGDIQTVSGVSNLAQALKMRLDSRRGELVYHPEYGNRAYLLLGKGNVPVSDLLAASWTAAAIKADPRVSKTENMIASTRGDVLSVTGVAVTVNGKRLPIGLLGEGGGP